MKRWGIFFLVFAGAMYLSNSSVFAERGGGVGGGGGRSCGLALPSRAFIFMVLTLWGFELEPRAGDP